MRAYGPICKRFCQLDPTPRKRRPHTARPRPGIRSASPRYSQLPPKPRPAQPSHHFVKIGAVRRERPPFPSSLPSSSLRRLPCRHRYCLLGGRSLSRATPRLRDGDTLLICSAPHAGSASVAPRLASPGDYWWAALVLVVQPVCVCSRPAAMGQDLVEIHPRELQFTCKSPRPLAWPHLPTPTNRT